MSGTQDIIPAEQNSSEIVQSVQTGIDENEKQQETQNPEQLTPAQKMDNLLRGSSSGYLRKEIEKLRKESARYRIASKTEAAQKLEVMKKAAEVQKELDMLKESNRNLKIMRALDKAGCIKSDLVSKDIPLDCEDIDEFIKNYKDANQFLFKNPPESIGSTFKTSGTKNLTPAQRMDAFIRAAAGR